MNQFDEETREEHPTYGLVGFSRTSHGPPGENLFGSSIQHMNTITLRIRRAEKHRDLNRDWYFARENLIEVSMSPTQFAEAITCMNVGDGIPCTLKYVGGKDMGRCPEHNQRQVFCDEVKHSVNKAMEDAKALVCEANELLAKKNTTIGDKKRIAHLVQMLMQHIISDMPFVHRQFDEAMDKTVSEAKGEVEAFFLNKIHSLGLDALQDRLIDLLPGIPESRPQLEAPSPEHGETDG